MKYFIKTFGCQMNFSDSERIATFLENQGYKKAYDMAEADLIVVNVCSVRQSAIDRIFGLKKKFKKLKAKTILTGCFLKSDKKKFEKFFDEIVDIKKLLGRDYLSIKPKCPFSTSAFTPIMTGCDNFCSYCVVPYTRGREISRPIKEIINEVKDFVKSGYKEIILLGQNVNSYKPSFVNLLRTLSKIPGYFKIKFLTNHPKDFSEELIDTIADCEKVEKEIHLPVQSGDDEILRKMNRGYTVKKYKNLIKKIRKKIPQVKISTDVIVGFPGETKKQFENTVKLFKEIKFDKAYINKYSTRVGTAAVRFKDDVPLGEKKRRWKILDDIVNKPTCEKQKLIVILGPTASGKSGLAVELAKEFNSEIISADSRQVYKGMNIGTGKITPDTKNSSNFSTGQAKKKYVFTHRGIPHYMLDVASPKKQWTVAEYRKKALEAIDKIYKKGKLPILCGGTGFYIQAVVDGLIIPAVKPDWELRKKLEKETTENLYKKLKKLNPRRAENIDSKNRRRLIRALEIVLKTGKSVPPLQFSAQGGPTSSWEVFYIGIKKSLPELKKAINKRVDKMIKNGLEKEVKKLIKKYGWTKVFKNTIGYKEWNNYQNKKEIIDAVKLNTYHYAKRQVTWFSAHPAKRVSGFAHEHSEMGGKQQNKIHWIKNFRQVEQLVEEFLRR